LPPRKADLPTPNAQQPRALLRGAAACYRGPPVRVIPGCGPGHPRRSGDGRNLEVDYRNKGAITKVTVQSSLMSGCYQIVPRKRRPFPDDVFFDL
jgi:hypothetical protein